MEGWSVLLTCQEKVKPLALDLFCCAGGATKGLQLAGFHVTGVDIKPQPRYCGDAFHQADALTFPLDGFDFIWASPPCQEYSESTRAWKSSGREYPDLIASVRARLKESGKPYCIENVESAPLEDPILLCGPMFGLRVYRHRIFESNFYIGKMIHPPHLNHQAKMGRPPKGSEFVQPVGHFSGVQQAREAMDIDWMGQSELAQAIPPAYAEFIGRAVLTSHISTPTGTYPR